MSLYTAHEIVLVANVENGVTAPGRYFRVLKSTGDLVVTVDGSTADFIQQGMGIPISDGFKRISFISPVNQLIIVAVSDGPIDDNRLSFDSKISVVDDAFNTAKAGTTFETYVQKAAVVGEYSHVGLHNQAGSGITCAIRQVLVSSSVGGSIALLAYTTANRRATVADWQGDNKLVGGPISKSITEKGNHNVSPAADNAYAWYRVVSVQANGSFSHVVEWPWILGEGWQLAVAGNSFNMDVSAAFEFEEY